MVQYTLSLLSLLLVCALWLTLSSADKTADSKEMENPLPVLFSPDWQPVFGLAGIRMIRKKTASPVETGDPYEIRSFYVNTTIQYRFARTFLCSTMYNPTDKLQEITFSQAVPKSAFVSAFAIHIDGDTHKATFSPLTRSAKSLREQYFSSFEEIEMTVGTNARNGKLFSAPVEVKPRKEVSFCLGYEEVLQRKSSKYVYPVHISPNQVVNHLSVTVHIKENTDFNHIDASEFLPENEPHSFAGTVRSVNCKSDVSYIKIKCISSSEVEINFSPSVEDQNRILKSYKKRKAKVYFQKLTETADVVRKFIPTLGLNGQFVVSYDVKNPQGNGGEILYNDKYFVHYLRPSQYQYRGSKHIVFLVDTSGFKLYENDLNDVKEGIKKLIDSLQSRDYMNIVDMTEDITLMNFETILRSRVVAAPTILPPQASVSGTVEENEATSDDELSNQAQKYLQEHMPSADDVEEFDVAYQAAKDQKKDAKGILDVLTTSPGANVYGGLSESLNCIKTCTKSGSKSYLTLPIIVYITSDVHPTVGLSYFPNIVHSVTDSNSYPRAQIFALNYAKIDTSDAGMEFLKNITSANDGYVYNIYPGDDIEEQISNFYDQISTPIMADVSFKYSGSKINQTSLTRSNFRALYWGSEVVLAGQFEKEVDPNTFKAEIEGTINKVSPANYATKKFTRIDDKTSGSSQESVLERIWAHLKIEDLIRLENLDYHKDGTNFGKYPIDHIVKEKTALNSKPSYRNEATTLSLEYSLFTPLTSLVINPNETEIIELYSIQPLSDVAEIVFNVKRKAIHDFYEDQWKVMAPLLNISWISGVKSGKISYAVIDSSSEDVSGVYLLNWSTMKPNPDPPQFCRTKTTPPVNGSCVHLISCVLPEITNDLEEFQKYHCRMGNKNYLAICCPTPDDDHDDDDDETEARK